MVVGSSMYNQNGITILMQPREWLAGAALWVRWGTQGSLTTCSTTIVVQLDCDSFGRCVTESESELVHCLRCCAALFAHQLSKETELSDENLPHEVLARIPRRALDFCRLKERRASERSAGTPGNTM